MERKDLDKIVKKAVKAHSDKKPADVNQTLIAILAKDATVNVTSTIKIIRSAFVAAGILAKATVSNLSKVRESLKTELPEFSGYSSLREYAETLQDEYTINTDVSKGIMSALKLIKAQMKENGLEVPRRSQLGDIAELKVEYYVTEPAPHTVKGLTQYLKDNLDTDKWPMTPEMEKRLAVSAGTDHTYSLCLVQGKTLSEMN